MTLYTYRVGDRIITTRKDPRDDFYHQCIDPTEEIEMIEIKEGRWNHENES